MKWLIGISILVNVIMFFALVGTTASVQNLSKTVASQGQTLSQVADTQHKIAERYGTQRFYDTQTLYQQQNPPVDYQSQLNTINDALQKMDDARRAAYIDSVTKQAMDSIKYSK
jgi:hypothetical protein